MNYHTKGKFVVSKNILIVESENDQYFIEAFIKKLNLRNIDVDLPICNITDYKCLGGIINLNKKLLQIKNRIGKEDIKKLGIILDADKIGIASRIEFINKNLSEICDDIKFDKTNILLKSKQLNIEIACYIMNINGYGELETVLRAIKLKSSIHADCLEHWRDCLETEKKKINDKYFDKFWVQIYQRYDICKPNESNAYKNCTGEISMKKDIWDFEHSSLAELKQFLQLFST